MFSNWAAEASFNVQAFTHSITRSRPTRTYSSPCAPVRDLPRRQLLRRARSQGSFSVQETIRAAVAMLRDWIEAHGVRQPLYSTTNKHEREHPDAEPEPNKAPVSADIANQLVGRWVGKPEIPTIGYNIEIEFVKNADGTVQGKLIGTDLKTFRGKVNPVINKWLRDFRIAGQPAPPGRAGGGGGGRGAGAGRGGGPPAAPNPRAMTWQFPNTQPWTFNGELSADGSQIVGVTNSAQGGTLLTFRKRG
jgi:hypothetical protein